MKRKKENLVGLMDGYFNQTGHHLNVNVFGRELVGKRHGKTRRLSTINNKGFLDTL